MRSSELASLAGVTVRALRHYHQVGVLEEPERELNGYRQYGVHDLIRVVRIRSLAGLGVPLDEMADLLDDSRQGGAAEVLERLDEELAGQIERLTAQRDLIARLREGPVVPDVPPELAQFLAHVAVSPVRDAARLDRDQAVLLAHLVGEDGMAHLVDYYELINDPELQPVLAELTERFEALGPSSSAEEIDGYVDSFVTAITPVVRALGPDAPDFAVPGAAELVEEYTASTLNRAQRDAVAKLGARLDALG